MNWNESVPADSVDDPLQKKSTEFIQYIGQKTNHHIPIIGSGGICSAGDAKEKMQAGAGLIQIWTGFIYEGPGW